MIAPAWDFVIMPSQPAAFSILGPMQLCKAVPAHTRAHMYTCTSAHDVNEDSMCHTFTYLHVCMCIIYIYIDAYTIIHTYRDIQNNPIHYTDIIMSNFKHIYRHVLG